MIEMEELEARIEEMERVHQETLEIAKNVLNKFRKTKVSELKTQILAKELGLKLQKEEQQMQEIKKMLKELRK